MTSGGKRPGAGRKAKEGWSRYNLKYQDSTMEMLKRYADQTDRTQSDIADEILSKRLAKLLK
jgi:hypothetical protein